MKFYQTYPHEEVACSGVQPSLSFLFTSAPCVTRNSTISRLSSMQAYKKMMKQKVRIDNRIYEHTRL